MVNVLLVSPDLNLPGGVNEFNKLLLRNSSMQIRLFVLSTAGRRHTNIVKKFLSLFDICRFFFSVNTGAVQIVHLGPSLAQNSIIRDSKKDLLTMLAEVSSYNPKREMSKKTGQGIVVHNGF